VAVQLGYKNVYRDPHGFPEWQKLGLAAESRPAGLAGTVQEAQAPGLLYGWAMVWTLLGIFVGGMALNLTPCIYPMIPITVSYFGGRATSEAAHGKSRLAFHGLCYVLGLAFTNSILGVIAALTGSLMGAALQHPAVLVVVAAVLVFLAASLLGLWELRLPSGLTQAAAKSYTGYFGSLFMGLTLGVVAAPCIGPFVLGLLTWVASMGSPWIGFIVFFTLSMGLGLPLFIVAIFSGQLQRLPRSGGWMLWVRKLMGWVLVGMAAYFLNPILREPAATIALSVVLLAAGVHLAWLDRNKATFSAFPWLKALTGAASFAFAAFLIASLLMRGPGVAWAPFSDDALKEAARLKRPVIIDFYAAWCAPCRELDAITFHDAAVVNQARESWVMIKVDVTQGGNPLHERLLRQFTVKGVPTVVFIDVEGQEIEDLRLVDFLPPDQFLSRMNRLVKKSNNGAPLP
jgi:thiol:disulfide interchange protein DsbD